MNDPHISTKDQVGDYDAIETAKPGEPLFPLQGGDPFAPSTVLHWVDLCRRAGMREADPKRAAFLLQKATAAEHVAWAMQAYQRGETEVVVDRAAVNVIAEDETRKWRSGLTSGTRFLRDAAFHLTDAAEHLPAEMAAPLLLHVETINKIASAYEPKRSSYGNEPELPLS